jgi:2-succinyl-6-hydroxy-2,4-cyclohexadiene-1-carboxylate synthase
MTPAVFLHGFLGSPDEWQPIFDGLDRSRPVRTATLPAADSWPLGIEQLVASLPERFVLVGYSMGARIALGVTLEFPQRVRGLCMIAGHPGLPPREREARRLHDDTLAQRLLHSPPSEFLDAWYRQEVFASISEATRTVWVRQRQSLDRSDQANLLRCYSLGVQPDFWSRLGQIAVPAQIVVGELDGKYVAIARAMQRQAPQMQLTIVPRAGHAVHREQPAALREVLQAFLAHLPQEEHEHE